MENLVNRLQEVKHSIDRVEIYYVSKSRNQHLENPYTRYEVRVPTEVASEIVENIFDGFDRTLTELTLVPHDPVIYEANTLEYLPLNDVDNFENIVGAGQEIIADLDYNQLWGYYIKVYFGDRENELIFFKKFAYPKLLKKSIKLHWRNDIFDKIENEVITIDDVVHSFSLDNRMYLLNKPQFEKFFNFSSTYQNYITQSVETLEALDVIENFEAFTTDCLDSDTLTRRLVKIIRDERFENLQRNITNVPSVIDDFALTVHFVENKIVYGDGSTITDIITLIKGACVYGALDSERYIANETKTLNR